MDVQLLVYDLSRGMARQMSMGILGFQLDAIYHTSIELSGREYVYDGGIVAIRPGSSHLGQPMEKIHLGRTSLTMDVVEEYIESVRPIFTAEAYDLFHHNCNNFSDSFSNFLLGKGIPSHISTMPQAVLESPMGRMLMPYLTQGINAKKQNGSILGLQENGQPQSSMSATPRSSGVKNVVTSTELSQTLEAAKKSSAIIFFTSATCGPCKALYPTYDQLAEEFKGQVTFIKVDIAQPMARDIASQFAVRATPTFVTFLKGQQENRWTGSTPGDLQGRIQLLAHMASPSHPHNSLRLPHFSAGGKPVMYAKVPPMSKLMNKMGELANDPEVIALKDFLETRQAKGAQDAVLPDLSTLASFIRKSITELPADNLFGIIDLLRCALADPRVSGYFAEENDHQSVQDILALVRDADSCPYALRLVTLQMTCNLFSTPLFAHEALRNSNLVSLITHLVSSSFLDESHNNVRVAASSLLFNVALADRQAKRDEAKPRLPEGDQVELAASVVEAIGQEEKSPEALQGMLSALGHLFYEADLDGELADLLRALDAQGTILSKKKEFPDETLINEVGSELLGKGLRKP